MKRYAEVAMLSVLLAITVLMLLVTASEALSQVINPRTVEFTASADHAVVLADGSPKVTGYEVRYYLSGAQSPVQSINIGKPTPGAQQKISVALDLTGVPFDPVQQYVVRVAALGPTGEGVSDPSNSFVRVDACAPPSGVSVSR